MPTHAEKALAVYYASVTYRGGPYFTPDRVDSEGNVWHDIVAMVKDQHAQWRMRTHFDSLDADCD